MGKWWKSAGNWMLFGQFMGKHETNRFQLEHLGFDLYHSCKYDGNNIAGLIYKFLTIL
jgi:hypothetical protein